MSIKYIIYNGKRRTAAVNLSHIIASRNNKCRCLWDKEKNGDSRGLALCERMVRKRLKFAAALSSLEPCGSGRQREYICRERARVDR